MFSGSTNVHIMGQPKFTTVNGEYTVYENETATHNINSNNVIGNTYTETVNDSSQTINYGRSKFKKGRSRMQNAVEAQIPTGDPVGLSETPMLSSSNTLPSMPFGASTPFPSHSFTTSSFTHNGYTQKFGNQPSNASLPLGIESSRFETTNCKMKFDIKPGDIVGMGPKAAQFFEQLLGAIEEEQFSSSQQESLYTSLPPGMSASMVQGESDEDGEEDYDDDDDYDLPEGPFFINQNQRPPPSISDTIFGAAALKNNLTQHGSNAGSVKSHTTYAPSCISPSTLGSSSMARQLYSSPVTSHSHLAQPPSSVGAQTPLVEGMAGLSLEEGEGKPRVPVASVTAGAQVPSWPVQFSSFTSPPSAPPAQDGVSGLVKNIILGAASMPDYNISSQPNFNPNVPRIETSSSVQLFGPPPASFESTMVESPTSFFTPSSIANSVSPRSSTLPAPASNMSQFSSLSRKATLAGLENVTIAPGAHVTSMTFNGTYTEVRNNHRTINHGMSGVIANNSVKHVHNNFNGSGYISAERTAGEKQPTGVSDEDDGMAMECDDENRKTKRSKKQGHIPGRGKKWSA